MAIELADASGTRVLAAAMRYRLGELLGGDAGAASHRMAMDSMTAQGVEDVSRFVDIYAPGFFTRA